MNRLRLFKLAFAAEFTADAKLPPYLGNSLRGALGRSLVRRCCVYAEHRSATSGSESPCSMCKRVPECAYGFVFKSQIKIDGFDSVTNPFVIGCDYSGKTGYIAGEPFEFTITLFGAGARFRDEITAAVAGMYREKLSVLRHVGARILYDREWSDDGEIEHVDSVAVELLTPLVLLTSHKLVYEIDFKMFADAAFNRISNVIDVYGDAPLILPYALEHRAPRVICEAILREVTIKQSSPGAVNGLLGSLRFAGDVTRYMPYIDLCSQLHLGKMTTRGCGAFAFEL